MTDFNKEHYFYTEEFKVLLDRYEKAESQGEPFYLEAEELTNIAEYYQDRGHNEKALHVIERALATFPGNAIPLAFMARYALLREDNPKEAKRYADQIVDKTDFDYHYLISEIMLYQGKITQADRHLRRHLTEIEEGDKTDYIYDVANLFVDYNANKEAQKWINYLPDKEGEDYQELQSRIYIQQNEYEKAIEILTRLVDKKPYSAYFWTQLAVAQYMQGNMQEALQSSEFAIAIDPMGENAILAKANCLFTLENNEKALEFYLRYTDINPNNANVETMIGTALVNLNKPKEAIAHFNKAMDLSANDLYAQIDIAKQTALALSSLGKADEALATIDNMAVLRENHSPEIAVFKGFICLENGKTDKAVELFNEALDISGNDNLIIYQIGSAAFDNQAYPIAYDMFRRITVDNKGRRTIDGWAYYAACCMHMHNPKDFLVALKMACTVNPEEVAFVFSEFLTDDVDESDYFEYLIHKITQ